MKLNRKQTPPPLPLLSAPLFLLYPAKNRMKCYLCMHVAVVVCVCVCVCQNIQYVYKFVCWATQAIKSPSPLMSQLAILISVRICLSLSVCVCAGAHVTQCWAIDLLLAISRICCQDMLGICQLSCFPSSPLPLPPSPLLNIDYRKSISGACHMLICPVYGPTSFVRTFFVASFPLLPCPASASLCLSINSRFRPQCLIPVYCRCYNSACCPMPAVLFLCTAANAILSWLYNIIACIRN